jgi:hypothetical protein
MYVYDVFGDNVCSVIRKIITPVQQFGKALIDNALQKILFQLN